MPENYGLFRDLARKNALILIYAQIVRICSQENVSIWNI